METAKIGPARPDDLDALTGLLLLLFSQEADFNPDPERQQRGLRLLLDSPHAGIVLTARVNDVPIGMVTLLFTISTAEGGPVCWLEDLVVRPEYRGRGLGTQLLQHAIDDARDRGFTRITLLTDPDNESAHWLYKRHGFQKSAMTPFRLHLEP